MECWFEWVNVHFILTKINIVCGTESAQRFAVFIIPCAVHTSSIPFQFRFKYPRSRFFFPGSLDGTGRGECHIFTFSIWMFVWSEQKYRRDCLVQINYILSCVCAWGKRPRLRSCILCSNSTHFHRTHRHALTSAYAAFMLGLNFITTVWINNSKLV